MEVPFLAVSTVLSLNDEVSIGCVVNIPTLTQSGDDMEVFVDNETVVSIPFTSGWFSLPVLGVDEIPLLVFFTIEFVHVDISVFSINSSRNIHDMVLLSFVSKEWSSPSEELEPS
jgi:hypothetical protein